MTPAMALNTQYAEAKRIRMIEQAMKDRAPQMYRELKASGKLQQVLEDRQQEMVESFWDAEQEILQNAKHPQLSLEWDQEMTMKINEAWHDAIEAWTEFPEESTTESPEED